MKIKENKKKISFASVNFRQGPKELNAYFLPYSVATLWAYAQSQPAIHQQWNLERLLWKREPIETCAQELAHNDLLGFSTYIWNRNYNYALAKRVKEINPNIITVFGGPEPAITDSEIFARHPYIDIIVKLEGEITLSKILLEYDSRQWKNIPGLIYNQDGRAIDTGDPERISDLALLPSPYLTGLFDDIVQNNPGHTWNATIETNRGCPYQCTFCDWGSLTYNKLKIFPLDRVKAEIDWVVNHAGFLLVADANFGILLDRDKSIIDYLIQAQKTANKNVVFFASWAKNQRAEVFEMINRLTNETSCIVNGLTVGVQTMTPGVLNIIKRTNLNQHKLREIFGQAAGTNVPIYTDLILGLPGETLQSWKQSLYQVFEAGNHYGIEIIQCQLLENAEMNLSQRHVYRMKTKEVMDYMSQTTELDQGPFETISVVTETSTMPYKDMLEAQVWNSFMQVMHMSGFASQISRYLNKAHAVSYQTFYDGLYVNANQDNYLRSHMDLLRHNYDHWMHHGFLPHPVTNKISQTGVNLITSLLLLIHIDNKIDHVHDIVERYVNDTWPWLETNLRKNLYRYQRSMIVRYQDLKYLPRILTLDYDFYGYLDLGQELENYSSILIDFSEGYNMSYDRFHENLYYGRKRGFGRSQIKKNYANSISL